MSNYNPRVRYVKDTQSRKWLRIDTDFSFVGEQGKIIKQSYLLNSKGKIVDWTEPAKLPEFFLNSETGELVIR